MLQFWTAEKKKQTQNQTKQKLIALYHFPTVVAAKLNQKDFLHWQKIASLKLSFEKEQQLIK